MAKKKIKGLDALFGGGSSLKKEDQPDTPAPVNKLEGSGVVFRPEEIEGISREDALKAYEVIKGVLSREQNKKIERAKASLGGRPKSSKPSKMYTFRMWLDSLEKLQIVAAYKRRSVSSILNKVISEYLVKHYDEKMKGIVRKREGK